jgi:hypothetical protein
MKRLNARRPSPAMVVALLALFVALGGSASALVVVTTKNIKNGTIRGKDLHKRTLTSARVKKNGLGGSVIKESSLGKVPNAGLADNAGHATSADSATTATQLGSFGATALVRVARAFDDNTAVSGTTAETEAVSTNIVVPTAGYLAITGSSDVFNTTAPDTPSCWISVGGAEVDSSDRTMQLATGNTEEDCGTNATVPVAPGTRHVALVGDPGATTTTFDEAALTVIFIPFGGNGAQPGSFNINGRSAHRSGN